MCRPPVVITHNSAVARTHQLLAHEESRRSSKGEEGGCERKDLRRRFRRTRVTDPGGAGISQLLFNLCNSHLITIYNKK